MNVEEVKKLIQSCLVTEKRCMPLRVLMKEFRELVGMNIPYTQLGYRTVVDLLKTIPGVRKDGVDADGDIILAFDAAESNMGHIQEMVKKQAKKTKPTAKYAVRRSVPFPRRPFPAQQNIPRFSGQNSWKSSSQSRYTPPSPFQKPSAPAPIFNQKASWQSKPQDHSTNFGNVKHQYQETPEPQKTLSDFQTKPQSSMKNQQMEIDNVQQKKYFESALSHEVAPKPFSTYNQENWSNLRLSAGSLLMQKEEKFLREEDITMVEQKTVEKDVDEFMRRDGSLLKFELAGMIKDEPNKSEILLPPKLPRVKEPTIKNHQLIGDDFLLYFAYCNLKGKMNTDFVSCGMCYSGATVKQSLFQVRLNSDFIFYKTIIMLGHIDVLEDDYDPEKTKWYMTLLLERMAMRGTKVTLLTLPPLDGKESVTSKRINDLNNWIRTLHDPPIVSVIDLERVFVTSLKPLSAFYKSQKHVPSGRTSTIAMWSKFARAKVSKLLEEVL